MNLIVNGITNKAFESFEATIESHISSENIYYKLRDMNLNFCIGCWDCWVKTPGVCRLRDDYVQILSQVPKAQEITIITPILAGYESHLIKTFSDRMIPICMPYIEIHKGEQHHVQRYEKNPNYRLIVVADENTQAEDIDFLRDLYERKLLNFKADLIEVICIKEEEDLKHVINRF